MRSGRDVDDKVPELGHTSWKESYLARTAAERAGQQGRPLRSSAGRARPHTPDTMRKGYRSRRATAPRPLITRNRLRVAEFALVLALCGLVVAAAFGSPLLSVRRVRVVGLAPLRPDEAAAVQALATPHRGAGLLRLPAAHLAARLASLPCIASAEVHRRLPSALDVTVRSRRPAAVATADGGRWEIDAAGRVIRPARGAYPGPPIQLDGPEHPSPGVALKAQGLHAALACLAAVSGEMASSISKIEVDLSQELCLNMRDGTDVLLGGADDLTDKIAAVRRIYQERPNIADEVVSIDMRCLEAPAYTPRKPATALRFARQQSP